MHYFSPAYLGGTFFPLFNVSERNFFFRWGGGVHVHPVHPPPCVRAWAGCRRDYKKELLFHKFWNVLESYQQKDALPQLFCNFCFRKNLRWKIYNLFSHWNRDRERLSRFVNTAKHISWHPPTVNSRPLLFDTPVKFGYSNRGLTREVRFSISIWEVRTKNGFKFWTTKPNLDSWQNAWPGLTVISVICVVHVMVLSQYLVQDQQNEFKPYQSRHWFNVRIFRFNKTIITVWIDVRFLVWFLVIKNQTNNCEDHYLQWYI